MEFQLDDKRGDIAQVLCCSRWLLPVLSRSETGNALFDHAAKSLLPCGVGLETRMRSPSRSAGSLTIVIGYTVSV